MKTLLVVDDVQPVRQLAKIILQQSLTDAEILEAANGKEAVEVLKTRPVDVVLTDYQMPEMDGAELCNYIKQHYPGTKVALMSGIISGTTNIVPIDKADVFINKPFHAQHLLATIMGLL